MQRWMRRCGALLAAMLVFAPVAAHADSVVPKDVYEWVQSTARQSYYFNKKVIHYGVDADGYINLNEIVVPVLKRFDNIQRDDIVAKRRWKGLPLEGYNALYGAADYLVINTATSTVTVRRHEDLDMEWGVLSADTKEVTISFAGRSEKDVDRKFYQAIIDYVAKNRMKIIEGTKGALRPEDKKRIDKELAEQKKAEEKAAKEREKAEREAARKAAREAKK